MAVLDVAVEVKDRHADVGRVEAIRSLERGGLVVKKNNVANPLSFIRPNRTYNCVPTNR